MINGELNASLIPLDRGLNYGDGIFTTMRWRCGSLEWYEQHIARLLRDASLMLMRLDERTLISQFEAFIIALKQNGVSNAIVKCLVTRGVSKRGYAIPDDVNTNVLFIATPLREAQPDSPIEPEPAVDLYLCQQRLYPNVCPQAKHLNRLEQVFAKQECIDHGFVHGLMLSHDDYVTEATSANIFWSNNQQLFTPSIKQCGIKGVMRDNIIAAAQQLGITVNQDDFQLTDLLDADTVWISNCVVGMLPVASLSSMSNNHMSNNHAIEVNKQWTVSDLFIRMHQQLEKMKREFLRS